MRDKKSNNIRYIAFKIYKECYGKIKIIDIAKYLNVSSNTVYSWKRRDNWDKRINSKVGAPLGNKNAIGNKGGGAPKGNLNALYHGLYMSDESLLPSKRALMGIILRQERIINDLKNKKWYMYHKTKV